MATYLELAQQVRLLSGVQGNGPASVTTVQGIEEVIVKSVRDAWVDIQNMREEWSFLEASGSFQTQMGIDEYSVVVALQIANPRFKKWSKPSFRITDAAGKITYLKYVERNVLEARYLNSDITKLPTQYAIDPSTNALVLKPIPDDGYIVDYRYFQSPEILSTASQVPTLGIAFHDIIAYKAVQKMAVYLSSPETYREYSTEVNKMLGQMMRNDIPKKRMNAGALV